MFVISCEQKPKPEYTKAEYQAEMSKRKALGEEISKNTVWKGRIYPYGEKIKVVKVKDCEYILWLDFDYFFHYDGCLNIRHDK